MNLTAIILAGGKSSRMGEDKGLMLLDDKPMIQHIIDAAKYITNQIIIVSNNSVYEKFGYPVFEDEIKDKGPLAGIYTGLIKSETQKNLILSCDIPYISKEVIEFLVKNSGDFDVTLLSNNGKTHQLISVIDKNCSKSLKNNLLIDNLKLKTVFNSLNLNIVEASQFDSNLFSNINSKNDLKT